MLPRISQQDDAAFRFDDPRLLFHARFVPGWEGLVCRGSAHPYAASYLHEFPSQCRQFNELQKVLKAELTLRDWESEVLRWAERNALLATAVGSYFLRHVWSPVFILSVIRFVLALLRQRFLRLLYPIRARLSELYAAQSSMS